MAQHAHKEEFTILEAVDNLTSMADIDIDDVMTKGRAALEVLRETARWLDIEDRDHTKALIKKTFNVVHDYMKHVITKDAKALKDVEVQKGIRAIMGLTKAAASRVDDLYRVLEPRAKEKKAVEYEEYRSLSGFYQKQVIEKFKEVLEKEEAWMNDIPDLEQFDDNYTLKIRDIEEVKRDQEYELFYIRKENGRTFFSNKLLRNLKLVTDFDEMISEIVGDDPLIYSKVVQDKDAYITANEILESIKTELDHFVTVAKLHKEHGLTQTIYKALMALMAAANRENLIKERRGKSCLGYFRDFHVFLRHMINHEDYLRYSTGEQKESGYEKEVVHIVHTLCGNFFLHSGDQLGSVEFIRDMLKRGQMKDSPKHQFSIWTWILDCYDSVHHLLKHYPNGPLMKTIDIFKDKEYKYGYSPMDYDNYPYKLFRFKSSELDCTCIKLPSPTRQKVINQASVVEEFKGFMRHLSDGDQKKQLLIFNLQDRTSWKGHARSDTIEKLQSEIELKETLLVVSLAKHTQFYHQAEEYLMNNDATSFMDILIEQIEQGKPCGFYFPPSLDREEILQFSKDAIVQIHDLFFNKKNVLTRKNRLDFIEIFYQFLEMKIIFMCKPSYISYSCKDGVDIGSTSTFGLYGFLKLMHTDLNWSEEEKDLILRMIFAPALLVRERNVEIQRLSRIVSVLALINSEIDVDKIAFAKAVKELMKAIDIKDLEIYPANY
ncbi:MAG: hypothetical protein P0S95_01250 [Rhabdochlamydiaceae bacterium]|nr:hypothetical protein [Candidatus Amphrikana amoebophyrae]